MAGSPSIVSPDVGGPCNTVVNGEAVVFYLVDPRGTDGAKDARASFFEPSPGSFHRRGRKPRRTGVSGRQCVPEIEKPKRRRRYFVRPEIRRSRIFLSAFTSGMSAVTGDFYFVGSGVLTELAAILFSGGSDTYAGRMSAFTRFCVCHGFSPMN
jgi:hypothetical protein